MQGCINQLQQFSYLGQILRGLGRHPVPAGLGRCTTKAQRLSPHQGDVAPVTKAVGFEALKCGTQKKEISHIYNLSIHICIYVYIYIIIVRILASQTGHLRQNIIFFRHAYQFCPETAAVAIAADAFETSAVVGTSGWISATKNINNPQEPETINCYPDSSVKLFPARKRFPSRRFC